MGAYTEAVGLEAVRRHVAEFIEKRDGYPSNPDDIFLSNGASDSIKVVMNLVMSQRPGKDRAGIMIPVPRYPLYTATISEFGACSIPYYMDEDNHWGLSVEELEHSINEVRQQCNPRAIVIINPGNPTGQVLSAQNIKEIIKFAYREKLLLLADEVYQQNILDDNAEFHSFKKMLRELEESGEIPKGLELASFMSASKGFMGECGLRGASCELTNFKPDVKSMLFKNISAAMCSTTIGQATMDVICNPPQPGEPSYENFCKERDAVLNSLKEKAAMISETFNSMPGISCQKAQGAMYTFPRLHLPKKAIEAAKKRNQVADEFYCFELLDQTGMCVVPGSGFGQKPGTYHLRTTFLPPVEMIRDAMGRFRKFHMDFLKKYDN
jgi:alanine transaminase